MDQKIKIGILGGASIAERYLIPSIQEMSSYYELVGVASRTEKNARHFAELVNTKAFVGYDSLIQSGKIDAVYIPLPNGLHYEWVKKSLEAGLHVLVEKSLACHAIEVEELTQLAQSSKLALVENFQFRFHSQLQELLEIVERGEIGELRCIRSSFGFPPFSDEDNIRYKKELGGGALLDAGAYTLKISQMLMGNDCEVTAASLYVDPQKGVDTWGGGFIQHSSGLFSEIAFGFDHYYQCSLELWGSKGKLFTNRIFTAPPGFIPEVIIETASGKEKRALQADHHFKKMLKHFYGQCKAGGTQDEHAQNLNQARLIETFKLKAQKDGK